MIANASLNQLHADVVSLKTTIANAKLVGVTATLVVALLGGVGIWQIVKTQLEISRERTHFAELSEKADKLLAQHSSMMKESLIDRIELDLNSEASLDSLKGKPQLAKIRANAKELEALNTNLPSGMQSSYYKIGSALDAFLGDNCKEVLRILDQFDGSDRDYFGFAYMQGACYLRNEKPDLAREAFARASKLTEGKRVQMTLNAQAVSNLALWKASRGTRPHEAEEALAAAILQFENLKTTYPDYAAAFLNLACAYSAKRDFAKTSQVLAELRVIESPESISQRIQEDMTRPSDGYLTSYVREELKIVVSPNDLRWKQQVVSKLPPAKS
jgi:hypothetical protein